MIDTLINDIEKKNQVMKLEEKDAQDEYGEFMSNLCSSRRPLMT